MPRGFNDYDTARIQGRLWTPEVLLPAAWFDAGDLSTITVATGVSEWRDKSGNNNHATQATGSLQPTFNAQGLNGKPTVTFNGKRLSLTTTLTYADKCSIFSVTQVSSGRLIVFGLISTFYGPDASFSNFLWRDNTDSGITATLSNAAWLVSSGVRNASKAANVLINGADIANNSNNLNSTFNIDFLGYRSGYGGQDSNGSVAEAIIVSDAVSDARRRVVEGYLAWKWGVSLAADHPYANRPPLIGE